MKPINERTHLPGRIGCFVLAIAALLAATPALAQDEGASAQRGSDSPLYEGDATGGTNALNRGRARGQSGGQGDGAGDRANYNNSRSNKSTVAGPDTNVCDGVTCSDGSCAATPAECGVVGQARSAASYNNSRSNRSTVRGPGDSDGDGLDDGNERANYNNSRSNKSKVRGPGDSDSDADGLDDRMDTVRARSNSHNSSRSNRTEGVAQDFNDADSDGDGLSDEVE
ncbi:MAG: hypothetical protein ACQETO_11585 [Pseudomonadota bacterium]